MPRPAGRAGDAPSVTAQLRPAQRAAAVARESATANNQNSGWATVIGLLAVCVAFHAAEPKT